MVKFENRVSFNKIYRFTETSPLIVLFNCSNLELFEENSSSNFLLQSQSTETDKVLALQSKFDNSARAPYRGKKDSLLGSQAKDIVKKDLQSSSKDFTILLVKNKHLQKALYEIQNISKKEIEQSQNLTKDGKTSSQKILSLDPKEEICGQKRYSNNKDNNFVKINGLFEKKGIIQGNRFVLFYGSNFENAMKEETISPNRKSNLNFLSRLKATNQSASNQIDCNISVLGGVYKNVTVDHNQINRLLFNSERNAVCFHLKNKLNSSCARVFSCLNRYHNLITLLKFKSRSC